MANPGLHNLLASYPGWFVAACAVVAAAAGLWVLVKLLKWTFWFLLVGALLAAAVYAAVSLLR